MNEHIELFPNQIPNQIHHFINNRRRIEKKNFSVKNNHNELILYPSVY